MPPRRKIIERELAAFVGVDSRGQFAWGTIRPTRESCAEAIERFASTVPGFPPPLRIMPVWIGLDLNRQLGMPLDQPQAAQERL